jgi:hypothetical protein
VEVPYLVDEECLVVEQGYLRKYCVRFKINVKVRLLKNYRGIIKLSVYNFKVYCSNVTQFTSYRRRSRKDSENDGSSPTRSRSSITPSPSSKAGSPTTNQKVQIAQTPSPLSDSSGSRRRSSMALSSPSKLNLFQSQ